jgi:hypothetical protein
MEILIRARGRIMQDTRAMVWNGICIIRLKTG